MRSTKSLRRAQSKRGTIPEWTPSEWEDQQTEAYDTYEIFRVTCPDCGQPIALLADEEVLPEHALCPTPWDPFGLTVCPGSGRVAPDTDADTESAADAREQDAATLLTLPEGLDWRTQPFSHVGGPGTRPLRRRP